MPSQSAYRQSSYRSSPHLRPPWLVQRPLGFSVSSAPRRSGTGNARHGGDRSNTTCSYVSGINRTSPTSSLTSCDPRVATATAACGNSPRSTGGPGGTRTSSRCPSTALRSSPRSFSAKLLATLPRQTRGPTAETRPPGTPSRLPVGADHEPVSAGSRPRCRPACRGAPGSGHQRPDHARMRPAAWRAMQPAQKKNPSWFNHIRDRPVPRGRMGSAAGSASRRSCSTS